MSLSPLVACGLFLGLLAFGLEGKPTPQHLQKSSAAALGRELAERLEGPSGPAGAARGAKAAAAGASQPKVKGAASSASRLMRDLRTDGKQARGAWARGAQPEHHAGAGGGGGGGGGGSRRFKGLNKKGLNKGCFGLKLDRIGSMSGLGC